MKHLISTLRLIQAKPRCLPDGLDAEKVKELRELSYIYTDGYGYLKLTTAGRGVLRRWLPQGRASQVLVPLHADPTVLAAHGVPPDVWKRLIVEVSLA